LKNISSSKFRKVEFLLFSIPWFTLQIKMDGNMMSPREAVVESILVTVLAFANSSEFLTRKYADAMQTAP